MAKMTLSALTMGVACVVAGCAEQPSAPVQHIQHVERGDNALTCAQVNDKLAEMDKLIGQYRAAQQQSAAAKASTDSTMTTMAYIPVVGAFAGLGMSESSRQEAANQQASQDLKDATDRRDTLITIGNGKGCFSSDNSAGH